MENANTTINNQAPTPENKHFKFDIKRKDRIIAAALLFLSILGVSGGLWGGFRVIYGFSHILILTLLSVFLFDKKQKLGFFEYSCGALAFLSFGVYIICSNGSVKFWTIVCSLILSMIWLSSISGKFMELYELIKVEYVRPRPHYLTEQSTVITASMDKEMIEQMLDIYRENQDEDEAYYIRTVRISKPVKL